MRRTDVIIAIDGIMYDTNRRLDKGQQSTGSTIIFCLKRLKRLRDSIELEEKYNALKRAGAERRKYERVPLGYVNGQAVGEVEVPAEELV